MAVWITEVGGPRIVQVPDEAIIAEGGTDAEGQTTYTVVVDRLYQLDTGWLVDQFERITTELQVVNDDDEVTFWGPVLSVSRTPGAPTVTVSASDASWWFGVELLPSDEPTWDNQWLTNPNFEDELDGWTTVFPGPVSDNVNQESGSFCIDLDGGAIDQDILFTLFPEWTVRVLARVWIGAGVAPAERILRLTSEGVDHNVAAYAPASEVSSEEWGWLIRDVTFRDATGTPGTTLTVGLHGSGDDTVRVDKVLVQVSMPNLNPPGFPPNARILTPLVAWQSVVNAMEGAKNLTPIVDAGVPSQALACAWDRPDVFASEALRQIAVDVEGEWRMTYDATDRFATLYALVGVEHDPNVLTLELGVNVDGVTSWVSGTDRPVSEWLVADDEGFVGTYRDVSAFGGLLLQQWSQAPTGVHSSLLDRMAQSLGEDAGPALTDELTLVVPVSVASLLRWGDRVWLVVDDGPDQFDGWVRVRSIDAPAGAPVATVQVTAWGDGS